LRPNLSGLNRPSSHISVLSLIDRSFSVLFSSQSSFRVVKERVAS
jgi:hypothetical protein